MTDEKTVEMLKQARGLIDSSEKWIKFASSNNQHTKFCGTGAVAMVAAPEFGIEFITSEMMAMFQDCVQVLRDALPHPHNSVIDYNDAPETTHADIMYLFDRAIATVEARKPAAVEAPEEEEVFA